MEILITLAGIYKDTISECSRLRFFCYTNLVVKPNSSSTTNLSICSKQLPFSWNGNTYTAAGVYKDTLVNAAGCDSFLTLNLIVKPNSSSTTNLSICSRQLPFSWNGNIYTAAGVYKDTLVNAVGCDSFVTLNLVVKPNSASTTNVAICGKKLPYLWNGHSYNVAGTYKDTLVNAAGCDSLLTLNLQITPVDTSKTLVTICQYQLPYSWNNNSYAAAGTYTVILTTQSGCDSAARLILNVKPMPATPSVSSNSPLCSGETLSLTANSTPAGITYKWIGPNGFGSLQQNPSIHNISISGGGTYSAFAHLNGCISQPGNAAVMVTATPIANAGANRIAYEGDTIQLSPVITSTSTLNYKWTPSLFFITPDTVRNPQLLGVRTTTYYLTVSAANQCTSKADPVTITILPRKNPFNFPNVFSPNGDGINDKWELKQLSAYVNARVEIFDRAGTKVFSLSKGYNKAWDGTYNGKPVPAGTYYYIIEPNQNSTIIKGWVTIIR